MKEFNTKTRMFPPVISISSSYILIFNIVILIFISVFYFYFFEEFVS